MFLGQPLFLSTLTEGAASLTELLLFRPGLNMRWSPDRSRILPGAPLFCLDVRLTQSSEGGGKAPEVAHLYNNFAPTLDSLILIGH